MDFLRGLAIAIGYFTLCAACVLLLRARLSIPTEVFRKTLHMILLGSIFIWTYAFESWLAAALGSLAFAAVVLPALVAAERIPGYSAFVTERKRGELKRSLVVVFCMFAALIGVCWGWLHQKHLIIASVLAWGLGDAAAALVGKRFGKRFIVGRLVEGRKSVEGTCAMFVIAFLSVFAVLWLTASINAGAALLIALLTAAVCALVELYTRNGMDTVTCPFAAAATMIPLLYFAGSIG